MPHPGTAEAFAVSGPYLAPALPASPAVIIPITFDGPPESIYTFVRSVSPSLGLGLGSTLIPFLGTDRGLGIASGLAPTSNATWQPAAAFDNMRPYNSGVGGTFPISVPRIHGGMTFQLEVSRSALAGSPSFMAGVAVDRGAGLGIGGPITNDPASGEGYPSAISGAIMGQRSSGVIPVLDGTGSADLALAAFGGLASVFEVAIPEEPEPMNLVFWVKSTEERLFSASPIASDGYPSGLTLAESPATGWGPNPGTPTTVWRAVVLETKAQQPTNPRNLIRTFRNLAITVTPLAGNTAITAKMWVGWWGPFQ